MKSTESEISKEIIDHLRSEIRAAVVWLKSCCLEWQPKAKVPYEQAALRMLRLLGNNTMSIMNLASAGVDQAGPALVIGRACLETGLTVKWMLVPRDENEVVRRWLGCHREAAHWMNKVATRSAGVGFHEQADGWTAGARQRDEFVANFMTHEGIEEVRKRPDVASLCRAEGLGRLYFGYQLASQFTHGTLMASEEFDAPGRDGPLPEDWLLPLSMAIWAILFGARSYAERVGAGGPDVDPTPIHRAMSAFNNLTTRPKDHDGA